MMAAEYKGKSQDRDARDDPRGRDSKGPMDKKKAKKRPPPRPGGNRLPPPQAPVVPPPVGPPPVGPAAPVFGGPGGQMGPPPIPMY